MQALAGIGRAGDACAHTRRDKEEVKSMDENLQSGNDALEPSGRSHAQQATQGAGTLNELEAVNRELLDLLEGMEIPVLLLDERLQVRRFTANITRLFRLGDGDAGRPLQDIARMIDDPDLFSDARAVLQQRVAVEKEIQVREDESWYRRRILPYRAAGDTVQGLILSFENITQSKRAEESLRKSALAAEAASRAKTRFLSAVGHDLGQPLQALGLLNGVLARRTRDSELRGIIDKQHASMASMQHLLNVLLDQCRLDAGTLQPEAVDFHVADVLESVQRELTEDAAARGIALRVDSCDATIRSDAALLRRIIHNLVVVAMMYTEAGNVQLRCRHARQRLRIEIRDTDDARLFESSIEEPGAAYEPGQTLNGLRLRISVAQNLARLLDLDLDVRWAPGKGLLFALEPPLAAASRRGAARPEAGP
jgi:two-component system, chemotaxis family, CheB/CheR fusion protein